MRPIGIIAAVILAAGLAAAPAMAAGKKHDTMAAEPHPDRSADQLNAQSLARAQAGKDSPLPGVDSTGNLNRMSDQDAMKGKAMAQPPMPFR